MSFNNHLIHIFLLILYLLLWPAIGRPRVLANQFQATVQMSAPSCPTVDWATHWWLRQSLSHSPLLWTEAEALGWARFPVSWSRPGPWWRQAQGRTPPPSTAPSSLPPCAAVKKPTSQTFSSCHIVFSFALNCNWSLKNHPNDPASLCSNKSALVCCISELIYHGL